MKVQLAPAVVSWLHSVSTSLFPAVAFSWTTNLQVYPLSVLRCAVVKQTHQFWYVCLKCSKVVLEKQPTTQCLLPSMTSESVSLAVCDHGRKVAKLYVCHQQHLRFAQGILYPKGKAEGWASQAWPAVSSTVAANRKLLMRTFSTHHKSSGILLQMRSGGEYPLEGYTRGN